MQITEMPEIVSSETLAIHLDDIKEKARVMPGLWISPK